jgi:hypothetical protein
VTHNRAIRNLPAFIYKEHHNQETSNTKNNLSNGGIHSWGATFGTKDYVAVDLGTYHDLLLFDQ